MSKHNANATLITEPFQTDNCKDVNSISECATHIDISHLTSIQQTLVIQMASQFNLANSSKILVSIDGYDDNNHSVNCLLHPKLSAQ
jgi:hypothetical protein